MERREDVCWSKSRVKTTTVFSSVTDESQMSQPRSFTHKLAFQHLITVIVLHERHKMANQPRCSQPQSTQSVAEWKVWFSPLPSYRGLSAAAAFSRSESRLGAKCCTSSLFMLSLVSFSQLTDGIKTDRHKQWHAWFFLFFFWSNKKKQTKTCERAQRWAEQSQDVEHKAD